jgi:dipeptidyl aminopeptidase/acylaminoacyl peptidase
MTATTFPRAWRTALAFLAALPALLLATTAHAAGASPTGLLWHNSYILDHHSGVQVSSLAGGKPVDLTNSKEMDVAVWPDGRQFIVTKPDIYRRITSFVVMTPGGKAVVSGDVDGYMRGANPSPTDRRLVKVQQGERPLGTFEELVLDLQTLRPRYRIADDDWFDWMPDGRFMLISIKTGRMRIASVDGGPETVVGQLTPPADRQMGPFAVSPTGRELIMKMPRRNAVPREADLWIANIDGSRLQRLTEAKAIGSALWSPDGRFVAYTVDTGHFCSTAGYCVGGCDQWYTPATLRGVRGFKGELGSEAFHVNNRAGQRTELGCEVLAWTP